MSQHYDIAVVQQQIDSHSTFFYGSRSPAVLEMAQHTPVMISVTCTLLLLYAKSRCSKWKCYYSHQPGLSKTDCIIRIPLMMPMPR